MRNIFTLAFVLLLLGKVSAQDMPYPHPVSFLPINIELENFKMAYMDIKPENDNGRTVLLLHGKNFNGYYWKDVIKFLTEKGFRVVVPDQVGFGQSDRAKVNYSFSLLASNTKKLLDQLSIQKVNIIGHSMGGMLAVRFALMYPESVEKLILENPIGLEDYKTFVPYQSIDSLYRAELASTYESIKKYQQSYYPKWLPEYEPLVKMQAADLKKSNFKDIAWVNALTSQMIYNQPVSYELKNITVPTLLIIGQEDRTIVGKNKVPQDQLYRRGQYPQLGQWAHSQIPGSQLVELDGVGHIPHIQDLERFKKAVLEFL